MLRRFYDRILALAATPLAPLWLALISFAEASFFPLPPDVLLVPMVLARPRRAWVLAGICTAASVIGGALGYLIGYALFDLVAGPLLALYHYDAAFESFKAGFASVGLEVILIKGFTPIPYKIITIAAGAAQFNFGQFMAASLVTRGARFFLVAGLLRYYGEPAREFIEKRLTLITTLVVIGVVGGFVALKFL